MPTITSEQVYNALRNIMDPDLGMNIVDCGFVKDLEIADDSVKFRLELTTPACPLKSKFKSDAEEYVKQIPGVKSVEVIMDAKVRSHSHENEQVLPQVKHIIAVASGKGGVGKTTVAVNLALALLSKGAKVGLLDADIYGPSIPRMLGLIGIHPEVVAENTIEPLDFEGMPVMSFGFLIEPEQAAVWRGPKVAGMVEFMLKNVVWPELDYLIVDLPPGTGDAQLTLCQTLKLSGAIIVMTPQKLATEIALKSLRFFDLLEVPVLGIIENMSYILDVNGIKNYVFGKEGGKKAAEDTEVTLLGEIPLDNQWSASADIGSPFILSDVNTPSAQLILSIAEKVAQKISQNTLENS